MLSSLVACCLLMPAQAAPVTPAPTSAPAPTAATVVSLDGRWDLLPDPDDTGKRRRLHTGDGPEWSEPQKISVPGPLENSSQTADYDGVAWYRLRLPAVPVAPGGDRLMLCFDNANWRATVYLDGQQLGSHDGGDAPFRFDVTGKLERAGAVLVVRCVDPGDKPVEGLLLAALPNARESWFYNFGGLVGSVSVARVPPIEVRRHDARIGFDGSVVLRVDVDNHGAAATGVELSATLDDGAVKGLATTDLPPGETTLLLPLPGAEALTPWTPDAPVRHPLQLVVKSGERTDTTTAQLGLRRFGVEGNHFTLNGQPLYLRGVRYEPCFPRTLASPPDAEFLRREISAIRVAGFNLVHVPSRAMPDIYALCDEIGLLVQAEPTLGTITSEMDATPAAVDAALVRLSQAAAGHPSVVMASVLDEQSGVLSRHADELLRRAHELMPGLLLLDGTDAPSGKGRCMLPGTDAPLDCDLLTVEQRWPWTAEQAADVAALGQGGRLTYVMRWSCDAVPSFVDNVTGFGVRMVSDDARDYVAQLTAASEQFAGGKPLAELVRELPRLVTLCQAAQAHGLQSIGTALRGNPRLAGDCCAVWRDVGWRSGAGLCNAWGQRKPAVGVLADLNAAGRAAARAPAASAAAPVPLPPRPAQLVAAGSLVGLEPEVAAIVSSLVSGAPEMMTVLPRVAIVGSLTPFWTAETMNTSAALLRFVRDGGTLLLLDPPDVGRPFPQGLLDDEGDGQVSDLPVDVTSRSCDDAQAWLLAAANSQLFADIPDAPTVLDERFTTVLPERVLLVGPHCETNVQLGAVDGQGRYLGGAVQAVRYGAGHLVLSTLRLRPAQLSDPLAVRLLENLVRCTATIASRKPLPAAPSGDGTPPELLDTIARQVWRHRIYFGMAERLADQTFLGQRPDRDDLPDLATVTMQKNAGLDAIIAGNSTEGSRILGLIDRLPLESGRELFVRSELTLSDAFRARAGVEPPLTVTERQEFETACQRGRRLMRVGETEAALAELRRATDLLALPAAAPPDEPAGSAAAATPMPVTPPPEPAAVPAPASDNEPVVSEPVSGPAGAQP